MKKKSCLINIYTDGACRGNPGPGGWGALLLCGLQEKELFGGEHNTTNNRMELLAAISALNSIKYQCPITVHTDSRYMQKGITEWIYFWKKKNWITSSKTPVKNAYLWKKLDELVTHRDVEWRWIKGHAGNPGNERADWLANHGLESLKLAN
ncbi:MAG: ribonuclease HI [Burkholderia sp.]|nr:ribonuclease HI [Burkholderia sp.]